MGRPAVARWGPSRDGGSFGDEEGLVAGLGVGVGVGGDAERGAEHVEAVLDPQLGEVPGGRRRAHGHGGSAGPGGLQRGDVAVHGIDLRLDGGDAGGGAAGGVGDRLGVDGEDGHDEYLSCVGG